MPIPNAREGSEDGNCVDNTVVMLPNPSLCRFALKSAIGFTRFGFVIYI